jgi:shikimate kinase
MPVISMFYGVIVSMFYLDNKQHKAPHIHVAYQGKEAVIAIPSGEVLEGDIKANKLKLVQAWVEIHNEELMADWELAVKGQQVFKIEPLR